MLQLNKKKTITKTEPANCRKAAVEALDVHRD